MGLLQNGFRHNLTSKLFGATALDGAIPSTHVYWGHRAAANRNILAGEGIQNAVASLPTGARPPYVWVMARNGGGIKSFRRGDVSLTATAAGEMGLPRNATGAAVLTGISLIEGILSGSGSASITFDAAAAAMADGVSTASGAAVLDGTSSVEGGAAMTATGTLTLTASAVAGLIISATAAGAFTLSASSSVEGATESAATGTLTLDGLVQLVGAMVSTANGSATLGATAAIEAAGVVTTLATAVLGGNAQIMGVGTFTASTDNTGDDTLTVDAIAAEVLARLMGTKIPVNVEAVHGSDLTGEGTEANPWGPE